MARGLFVSSPYLKASVDQMQPLVDIPSKLEPPASNAQLLYGQGRFEETVAFCQKELPLLEKQIPGKSNKVAAQEPPESAAFQYFGLTAILVDSLAQLGRWKAAKEALGRYRMHFPRDPWGYSLGARVMQRDSEVKDREAVQEAVDLLEQEARRLQAGPSSKRKVK